MPRWSTTATAWTAVATADTTSLADNNFHAVQGGSTTQRLNVWEVKVGGLHTSALAAYTVLARDSTVAQTLTGGQARNAALDPATAALAAPQTADTSSSGTQPARSATLYLLDLGFNAFGGLIRLQLPPEGPIMMLGNAASFGEVSISNFTGGGSPVISSHIIYETI